MTTSQPALFDSSKFAQLHREIGELLVAANYACDQLGPYEQDTEHPRAVRALSVLRRAIDEVST